MSTGNTTSLTRWTLIFAAALILALLLAQPADAQPSRPRRTPTPTARVTPAPSHCAGLYGPRLVRCRALTRSERHGGGVYRPQPTPRPVRR